MMSNEKSKCLARELGIVSELVNVLVTTIGMALGERMTSSYIPGTYLVAELLDGFGIEYELKTGTVTVGGNRGKEKWDQYRVWLEVDSVVYDVGRVGYETYNGSKTRCKYNSKVIHNLTEDERIVKELVDAIGREYDVYWSGVESEEVTELKRYIDECAKALYITFLEEAVMSRE